MVVVTGMAVFTIVTVAISQVQWLAGLIRDETDTSHEEVMAKLKEIKDITMTTQKGVDELLVATDFMDEQLQLAEAETKILSHFNRMSELKRLNANTNQWDTWAAEVVDGNSGTAHAMSVIDYQISQNNVIGKFKVKAEAATRNKRLSRTVAGSITEFFKLQITYEMLGFTMLREANKHRRDWSRMNYEYRMMIQRFNGQIQQFRKVADSMPETSYFKNEKWEHNYLAMNDVRYAHLVPVEADIGKVVTGVQLYKYGNRVALKIKQGRLRENGRIDSESWKGASGWGGDYIKIYKGDQHYIDLHAAKAPRGKALVGMSLYQKGNRLAIKVKVASVDYLNGNIDGGGYWMGSPGWGHNYYNTHDHDWKYIDTWSVETKPPSMLTAAAFYRKGNRLAVQLSDNFSPDEQGKSCRPYTDVKMIGSYGCCDGFLYKRSGSGILVSARSARSSSWLGSRDHCWVPGAWCNWGPHFAIDGVLQTAYGKIFHSNTENYPWFEVELSHSTKISSVSIYNRPDCCGERFKNAEIRAGMTRIPDGTNGKSLYINTVCGTYQGPGATGEDMRINCARPIMAKFVTVQLKFTGAVLQINEIRIYTNECEEVNVNYGGNDIPGALSRQQNWRGCADQCKANSRCKFWTFRNSDGNCWLKTRVAAKSTENGLVSGPRDCPGKQTIQTCPGDGIGPKYEI